MTRKLTNEEIVERMYNLVGDEYSKLDDVYINANTKFPIKHNKCGHEYEIAWGIFQSGCRCPNCSGRMKLTNKDIVQKIYEFVGDEYIKLDDVYVNAKTKFNIRHELCNHEYATTWDSFQRGSRCPKCAGNESYTDQEVNDLILRMSKGEYVKKEKYTQIHEKILFKHEVCGYEYKTSWNNFKRGSRCPKCSTNFKLSNKDIIDKLFIIGGGEYTKMDNIYKNAKTKFLIRHNLCGYEYNVTWSNFQTGYRCPKCSQSRGEKAIGSYLASQSVSFFIQVKIDDCRYKKRLPFDFGIINNDKNIVALIEYDGVQHFKPTRFSYSITQGQAEENLKILQLRDQIKNQYCKDNNIPLLRIRYDEDIEDKLTKFLKEQNLIHEPLLKTV